MSIEDNTPELLLLGLRQLPRLDPPLHRRDALGRAPKKVIQTASARAEREKERKEREAQLSKVMLIDDAEHLQQHFPAEERALVRRRSQLTGQPHQRTL
eukprot:scaffold68891_cov32-Tisochrysis_lutea.AAC.1